jgi:hypothetical protein
LVQRTKSPFEEMCHPFLETPCTHLTDTSPANLEYLGYLALLHPEVPVLFCRCNALDLGVSLYFRNFRRGQGFSYDLEATGRTIALADKLIDHWLSVLPNPVWEVAYGPCT